MLGKLFKYFFGVLFVAAALCATALLWVVWQSHPYIYANAQDVPTTQAAIVPGASIVDGALSQVLRERADEAILLYSAGKVQKILVSGDNATLSYDEVDPVAKYMESRGIPAQNIFLDHAGFDTYSSMYRAKVIFGVTSATVVSQPFHLPRAVFIARELGIQAYGVDASQGEWFVANWLREAPATVKALYDLAVHRVPEYLGPQIPITGTGTSTQPALQ